MNKTLRGMSGGLLVLGLLGLGSLSRAADQGKINEAVTRGGKYLQTLAASPNYVGGTHGVGAVALTGLALLEANIPVSDPALQNVIRQVRAAASYENKTYNVALSIIFLDRLGQKEDTLAIQMLGIRLYAGLTANGGWGYNCMPEGAGPGGFGGMPIGGIPGVGMPGGPAPGGFAPPPGGPGVGPNMPSPPGFPPAPGGAGMGPMGPNMPSPPGFPPAPGGAGMGPMGPNMPSPPGFPPAPGGAGMGPMGPNMPSPPGFPPAPGGAGMGPMGPNMPSPPGFPPRPGAPGNPAGPRQPDNGFPQPGGKRGNPKAPPDNGFPTAPKEQGGSSSNPDEQAASKLLPEAAQYFLAVRAAMRGGRAPGEGDNSNTQFGLIALWIAARYGVPAQDAFALIEARFLSTQNRASGGWGYMIQDGTATPSMTCAGLLGLAVGAGRTAQQAPPPSSTASKGSNDPFDNPVKKGGDVPNARRGLDGARKTAVDTALLALAGVMRAASGKGGSPVGLGNFVGLGNEYYLLWSIERVCMAYGLDTLGDVDWHDWGCNYLLTLQQADGSWTESGQGHHYDPDVNTSFALLFLTRSNFVKDLSARIRGSVRDPSRSELRGSNAPALFAPKSDKSGSSEQSASAPDLSEDPTVKKVMMNLLDATGPNWQTQLEAAKTRKGHEYTLGLTKAIPLLDPTRKKEAREALAERLTRMTAATLRRMMNDPQPELRRAAVLACGMKEDLDHVVDLIERMTDSSDLVVRATRASLKSLVNQDFGPPPGGTDEQKEQAKAQWVQWLKDQQAKP